MGPYGILYTVIYVFKQIRKKIGMYHMNWYLRAIIVFAYAF